ncbi:MAG TPA: cupredoxin domain-containing protein [Actinomycetota bacterium]|nr:cupredoxin domain-containing protein [Actinomycetota bacterium]
MRKAPIRLGITMVAAAALVGSPAVPSVASVRVPSNRALSAATSVQRVKIVNFAFKPKTITITKGTKVKWTNRGTVNHTTTSNSGVWDSGPLAPGQTFSRLFKRAGTFRYHCSIHSTMHGKIIVS